MRFDDKNSLEKVQSDGKNSLGKVRDGLSALISDSKNSKKRVPACYSLFTYQLGKFYKNARIKNLLFVINLY